jgi:NAD(P)H-hydrate epimerase
MQKVITAEEMREIDRLTTEKYATPSLLLMEAAANSAARAIAEHLGESLAGKKARVFCGRGNNGGDGAALARALWLMGAHLDVIIVGAIGDSAGDARVNFEILRQLASFKAGSKTHPSPLTILECVDIPSWEKAAASRATYDIRVDALFGTGLTRPLEGIALHVAEHLALLSDARDHSGSSLPLIVSLDIPSGLNADSAQLIGTTVRADLTVTFTAPKPANVLPPASDFNGKLVVAEIGSPPSLLEAAGSKLFVIDREDARAWLVKTRYTPDSFKNTHGHALVIAGARGYSGAATLTASAAMRAGAGLVTIATPASLQSTIAATAIPEIMTAPLAETDRGAVSDEAIESVVRLMEKASVVAIGPGLTSDDERTRRFVRDVIEKRRTPVVIDADGLNALSPWPAELRGSAASPLILTPHQGEMLRLMGAADKQALADRVSAARDFAVNHSVILVLKGARTLIAAPDGQVFINPTGNAGLGTAGAGDTLTGIITGFIAQAFATLKRTANAVEATIAAVYVGGLAGDFAAKELGMRNMIASDIRKHLGTAIRDLDPQGERP